MNTYKPLIELPLVKSALPSAVLFDLDGTLVDSAAGLAAAVDGMLLRFGYVAAGEAKVQHWIGRGATHLVRWALADAQRVNADAVAEQDLMRGLEVYWQCYAECCGTGTTLYPGVLACLQRLQLLSIPCAVVTNKTERFVAPILTALSLSDYFTVIIGGDTTCEQKPHPLPLQSALQQLGCEPQNALMVGDSKHDINAAKAAGIPVVAVTYGYNHGQPITDFAPDAVLDDLSQLA